MHRTSNQFRPGLAVGAIAASPSRPNMNVHIVGGWPADMPAAAGQVIYRWWCRPATLARLARHVLAGERVWRVWHHPSSAFDIL